MAEVHALSDKIDFFRRAFGRVEVGARDNIQIKCPFCVEDKAKQGLPVRKRKLAIALEKNDVWHCWVCGRKGHIIGVLHKFCDREAYLEYMNRFADKDSIRINTHEEEEQTISVLPPDFKMLAIHQTGGYAKQALRYLKKRGITDRDLWYFKFGITDGRCETDEGWKWENRVIMPSFDDKGELNYFCGRAMGEAKFKYNDSEAQKTHIIFNELNIDWTQELTIVEGIFDLIKCNDNAVPLLGSDFRDTSALFMKILQHKTPVLLALDNDMSDSKIPWIVKMLMRAGIHVRVLDLDGYKDVGEMTKKVFLQRRKEAEVWNEKTLMKNRISRMRPKTIL